MRHNSSFFRMNVDGEPELPRFCPGDGISGPDVHGDGPGGLGPVVVARLVRGVGGGHLDLVDQLRAPDPDHWHGGAWTETEAV